MTKKKFIVAVSGGVDSSVLLHKLMQNKPEYVDYIVAHVDHGVRENSAKDAEFVKKMALKCNLLFRQTTLKINKNDENSLREARYEFLFKLKDEYKAEAIITAHHQDDILESMIINIVRGTSPRGLAPMTRSGILRPLLNMTKKQILDYAKKHHVTWVEDESNEDEAYLRNYIRKNIISQFSDQDRETFLSIHKTIVECYEDIDIRISHLVPKRNILTRMTLLHMPHIVAREVVRAWLLRQGVEEINEILIEKAAVAAKTLSIGKKIDVGGKHWLQSQKEVLVLTHK